MIFYTKNGLKTFHLLKIKKITIKFMFEKRLNFETAFKYPFNRLVGMWNVLWLLLPIFGWFAFGGYTIRIVQEFTKGKFKEVPKMKFGDDFKLGFFMFLKAIPFGIAYLVLLFIIGKILSALGLVWLVTLINAFFALLVVPVLAINFMKKERVDAFFEFKKVKPVFENFGDYIVALLKSIALGIIFCVLSIILIGIPAGAFTKNIFIADFYYRKVK